MLRRHEVVVCGPVAAELLVGTPASSRTELWTLLSGLTWAELGAAQWRRVGEVGAALRERGTLVPLTDVEIAVAAAAAGAELWSDDAHFDRIGAVMPELRRFRAA
jgi:predicted nucleic acid-binding protein